MKQFSLTPRGPTRHADLQSSLQSGLNAAAILVASLAIAFAAGCGTETTPSGNGTGITCGVGETVAQDSQGNAFCQKPGDAGTIAGNDAGGGGTDVATGGDSGGGAGGKDAGGSGGKDAGGGAADAGSAGTDGGGVDAGPKDLWSTCPPVKGKGLAHGKACTKHEECLYGYCMKGGHLAGYDNSISYCTKNNGCTGGASVQTAPCGSDDGSPAGVTYKSAFEKSKSSGNPKRTSSAPIKVCGRVCKSNSECASWNGKMPHCIKNSTKYISLGTQGVCGNNPLK